MRQLLIALTLAAGVYGTQQPYPLPQPHPGPLPQPHQRPSAVLQQMLLNLGTGLLYGVEQEIKIGKCRHRLNLGRILSGRHQPSPRCRY